MILKQQLWSCSHTTGSKHPHMNWSSESSNILTTEFTFRYAMVSSGRRVKGTRYNRAGWAALNTSDDTVAVSNPDQTNWDENTK